MVIFVSSLPIDKVIYRWDWIDEPELVVASEWSLVVVMVSWRQCNRHARLNCAWAVWLAAPLAWTWWKTSWQGGPTSSGWPEDELLAAIGWRGNHLGGKQSIVWTAGNCAAQVEWQTSWPDRKKASSGEAWLRRARAVVVVGGWAMVRMASSDRGGRKARRISRKGWCVWVYMVMPL